MEANEIRKMNTEELRAYARKIEDLEILVEQGAVREQEAADRLADTERLLSN